MIPTLTTERLTLRPPKPTDVGAYADFRASERSHFVGGPFPRDTAWQSLCAVAGTWHLLGYGRWIVTATGEDSPLGLVGLLFPPGWPEPEIGWTMFSAGEGKGFAYEAAQAARDYAYGALGWTTAISLIDPANTRSVSLGKRLGCRPDGMFEHEVYGPMHIWRHPSPAEFAT